MEPRNDKVKRRSRLRNLDVALAGEVEQAGALSLAELQAEVRDRELLGRPTKPATVEEWWEYARRRGVLEEDAPGEYRLSAFGREELASARERAADRNAPRIRSAVTYAVPPGAVGFFGGLLAAQEKDSEAVGVLVSALAVLLMFWVAAEVTDRLFARFIDPHTDPKLAAMDAAWLDGEEVRFLWRRAAALPAGSTMQRLYSDEVI